MKREAFKNAHYGFFFHFLNTGKTFAPPVGSHLPTPVEEWDKKVEAFDVKEFARQLHELKADYAFITLGQNSGYYCSPNKRYDELLGRRQTSKRDLVADFADELAKYGIDLYVYTTSMCPMGDAWAVEKLQALPPWNSNKNYGNYEQLKHLKVQDPRLRYFMRAWEDIHREWSLRWKDKVKGWWVDGCYFPKQMYDFADEPNGQSFMDAMRAGNPDAVIAFNPGAMPPARRNYAGDDEDYTAGEINNPQMDIQHGPMVDGLRYHTLTYVGSTWGRGPVRGTAMELAAMTRNITDEGGVVSWDLPFTTAGIDKELFDVLKEFTDIYWRSMDNVPPMYAEITQPRGVIPGSLRIESRTKTTVQVDWNGEISEMKIPGTMSLPSVGEGEVNLKISKNGLTRSFPVWTGQRVIDLSDGKPHLFDNGVNGKFTLQAGRGNVMYVQAEIKEKKSVLSSWKGAWGGSTLEVYLHDIDGKQLQYEIQPDGTRVKVIPELKKMPKLSVKKIRGGYSYAFPIKMNGPVFTLDLRAQTSVGNERDFLSVNLFGGMLAGSTTRDKHALIKLK